MAHAKAQQPPSLLFVRAAAPCTKRARSHAHALSARAPPRVALGVRHAARCTARADDGGGGGEQQEEEHKQADKSLALREFGSVSAVACVIGVVLFFFDMVVSLVAVSIGLGYAIAVLFEVRGAHALLTRMYNTRVKAMRGAWCALRRQLRWWKARNNNNNNNNNNNKL